MKIDSVKWKMNVPTKGIEADAAYAALETIREENGGLTDDAIVEAAKPENHVLHDWFEWCDSQAASEYRRHQARCLIRSLVVVYEQSPDITIRAYQVERKAPVTAPERTVYSTTEEVLKNPESHARLISDAIRAAIQFRTRFQHLQELKAIIDSIDAVVEQLVTSDQ